MLRLLIQQRWLIKLTTSSWLMTVGLTATTTTESLVGTSRKEDWIQSVRTSFFSNLDSLKKVWKKYFSSKKKKSFKKS